MWPVRSSTSVKCTIFVLLTFNKKTIVSLFQRITMKQCITLYDTAKDGVTRGYMMKFKPSTQSADSPANRHTELQLNVKCKMHLNLPSSNNKVPVTTLNLCVENTLLDFNSGCEILTLTNDTNQGTQDMISKYNVINSDHDSDKTESSSATDLINN